MSQTAATVTGMVTAAIAGDATAATVGTAIVVIAIVVIVIVVIATAVIATAVIVTVESKPARKRAGFDYKDCVLRSLPGRRIFS